MHRHGPPFADCLLEGSGHGSLKVAASSGGRSAFLGEVLKRSLTSAIFMHLSPYSSVKDKIFPLGAQDVKQSEVMQ